MTGRKALLKGGEVRLLRGKTVASRAGASPARTLYEVRPLPYRVRAGLAPALEILASMHPFSQKMTPPYSRVVALACRRVKE